jgi:glycosyltransferase involved in cell wall biosynthesis
MRVDLITPISSEEFAGVEKYAINILRNFAEMKTHHVFRLINFPPSLAAKYPFENRLISYGSKDVFRYMLSRRVPYFLHSTLVYLGVAGFRNSMRDFVSGYLRQVGYSLRLEDMGGSEIMHALTHFVPRFVRAKHVLATVHDLGPLRIPHLYPRSYVNYMKREFPWQLKICDRIVVESPATLEDVHEFYDIPRDRLVLIPLGVDDSFKRVDSRAVLQKYGIGTPYIFYPIGTIEPRKNLEAVIKAVHNVRERLGTSHVLVLTGRTLVQYPDLERVVEKGIASGIVRSLGHVAQDDMSPLYSGAELVVYPSIFEGFGLPILESMACGTPVAVSRIKAHEFVGGDAAYFLGDTTSDSIAEGITSLITDQQLRHRLVEMGLKRAARFSWEQTAKRMLDVYDSLA